MDRKPSNPETDSWITDRMASLDPAPGWNPDAEKALSRLTQPANPQASQWMRLGMTATILATTVFVLVLLPWQKLWTPEKATTTAKETVAGGQDPAPAQSPAPPQTESAKPAEKPAPEAEQQDALPDLPNNHEELRKYPETLAQSPKTEGTFDRLDEFYKIQAAPAPRARQAGGTEPKIVSQVLPEYTDEARQAKVTGRVDLVITIRTDGSVQFESVKNGLGYGLDEKAREAVEKWKFTPGQKDGVPVPTTVEITVTFSLR
jgi:TonB family protein